MFYNSTWSFRLGISQVNPISSSLALSAVCAVHSPWMINVFFGAWVNHFARLISWSASACPENPSIFCMSAFTATSIPIIRTFFSPLRICLPKVHSA